MGAFGMPGMPGAEPPKAVDTKAKADKKKNKKGK